MPYSPDVTLVGKRKNTTDKIPAIPAEIPIKATNLESTNILSIIS
jgi:hypothetical protein